MTAQECITTLRTLREDKRARLVRKIVIDKSFRPRDIVQQFEVLSALPDAFNLPLSLGSTAKVAASHKAMESLSSARTAAMLPIIKQVIEEAEVIPTDSNNIRTNGIHIQFSAMTVRWHMHLFLSQIDEMYAVGKEAQTAFSRIDENRFGSFFFQSCTNVARCLTIALLSDVKRRDTESAQKVLAALSTCFQLGMVNSRMHDIIFKEYATSIPLYNLCDDLVRRCIRNGKRDGQAERRILLKAVRPHGAEKVKIMMSNFDAYQRASFSKL